MKVKNLELRKFVAMLGLATAFTIVTNPMVVKAEEEILYEETNDNYTEEDIKEVEIIVEEENVSDVEVISEIQTTSEDEDVVYEETNTTPREFGEDEFIDADNWSPELDIEPNAGSEIPDDVLTEAERKGIVPDTPTNTPDEPTPIPKTGDNLAIYFLSGSALAGVGLSIQAINSRLKKLKEYVKFINAIDAKENKKAEDDKLLKVLNSKQKFRKIRKTKKLR